MKFFTTLSLVLTCCILHAQCPPPGDVFLGSQAQVDNFVATYPNCTEIAGSMLIGSFSEATDITNISGLGSLTSVGGNLDISANASLMSLTGLENLSSIGGYLSIRESASLTSLMGLDNLTSVGIYLSIRDNLSLTSLTGLGNLNSIGIYFFIGHNAGLMSLTGLDNLTSIDGPLTIRNNAGLTSLTGLENLTSIDGRLAIYDNAGLTSLTGLENLTSIDGELVIYNNAVLTSLTGLDNLDATTITSIGLIIELNPQLSVCAIESVCDYLGVAANTATILVNAMGCATREEVETACIVSTTDISQTNIELFPNPTNGMLQLHNITAEEVVVYTAQGQRVARYNTPGQELDLSALPAGVYHLQLIAADGAYVARVVKQ